MRKLFALLLAIALVLSCAAVLAEEAADENICTYTVYNQTGENVVELYLIDNNSGEKGENYAAGEDGMKPYTSVAIQGENYEGYVKSLYFKTASGYEATFATLHFETVAICLLPQIETEEGVDAVTSATPIKFSVPANYLILNQTGETVVEFAITDNASGEELIIWVDGGEGVPFLEDNEAKLVTLYFYEAQAKDTSMTLDFTTASGYTGRFGTLHVESVEIDLLPAPDANSGATAIHFGQLPE